MRVKRETVVTAGNHGDKAYNYADDDEYNSLGRRIVSGALTNEPQGYCHIVRRLLVRYRET